MGVAVVEQALRRSWVQVLSGRQEGRSYLLRRGTSTVGLDERADVGLFGDAAIVRRHAEIEGGPSGFTLRNVDASGRTRLNGQPVTIDVPLNDGDVIELGGTRPGLPEPGLESMGENGWSLEVVRGRQAGRSYAARESPETVLGNALAGQSGIDLGDQEGDSPRRMAARQAVVSKMSDRLLRQRPRQLPEAPSSIASASCPGSRWRSGQGT